MRWQFFVERVLPITLGICAIIFGAVFGPRSDMSMDSSITALERRVAYLEQRLEEIDEGRRN
jgi:hypothetical protein